jgi:hypothetical protein
MTRTPVGRRKVIAERKCGGAAGVESERRGRAATW